MENRYHFVGIGGSGMSALAQILVARGVKVSGSDRYYDAEVNTTFFDKLASLGISIFSQDGSGVEGKVAQGVAPLAGVAPLTVVVSTAIETDNPDIVKAKALNIPIIKRAELLAEIFNTTKTGIAITGTSGKTTTTAMTGFILHQLGLNPTIINGGIMLDFCDGDWLGNAVHGDADLMVIESDESDGSCIRYNPAIGVITNIHLDHKPLFELEIIFNEFTGNIRETLLVNADCPSCANLKSHPQKITFGIKKKADVFAKELKLLPHGSHFVIENTAFYLPLPGIHNVYNALAAIAVVTGLGIKIDLLATVLSKFKGIKRRGQLIGEEKGIKVIDDYAHNPDKIKATLATLKLQFPRLIAIFQPHGFGPTRLLKDGFIQVFKEELRKQDILFMPEIYYAGGTVAMDISSKDIITPLQKQGIQAYYFMHRQEIIGAVAKIVQSGDGIVVMGARDETLSEFCLGILEAMK
ncbi:MAG: UDP-N-acetylmuramate--L-alanine ligase [Nitrospirota bacterium]